MIKGIGIDIITIERIEKAIERFGQKFLDKIFTAKEQDYCLKQKNPSPFFAARFAAKEAVAKAIGTGFNKKIRPLDIEIIKEENGKPLVQISDKAKKHFSIEKIHVTLSHCKGQSVAMAIVEQ